MWMDLENIMISKISQTEKDKCYISPICGIKKIQMNIYKTERLTDKKKKTCCFQRREGQGDGYEIKRCKFLYVNEFLYSTGNCTQYFMIIYSRI